MKKLLTLGLVIAVVAMSFGSIAMPARAASAGDLIKMDGNPTVYYLGSDSKRYVFPNANAFSHGTVTSHQLLQFQKVN
jgi:hypothetical protein